MGRRIGKIVLGAVCCLLAVVMGYLGYVVLSYQRLEDQLELEIRGTADEAVPVGQTLTLWTHNIGFGAYSDDYSFFMDGGRYSRAFSKEAVLENTGGALGAIQAQTPDFVLLQEVDVDGTRSYHQDQSAMLAAGLPGYAWSFAQNYDSAYLCYPFHSPIGANRSGLMTFSKYKVESALRRSLPIEESLYKFLDLDRAYSRSLLTVENGRTLALYNVHLSAYTSDGTIANEQLKMLYGDIREQYGQGSYILVAGDFNQDLLGDSGAYFTRPEGEAFNWAKPFDTALLPEFLSCHSGTNVPTCRNADSPYRADGTDFVLSVDGFLVSDNVTVQSVQTVDLGFAYSDHNPVKLELILENP